MSNNGVKSSMIAETHQEIEDLENELKSIGTRVKEIADLLQNKYKIIASLHNEDYASEDFIQPTDFTTETLYYCLDPIQHYAALFFVPSEDGNRALPIQISLIPPLQEGDDPSVDIRFNPLYSQESLSQNGLNYEDILIKFKDLSSIFRDDLVDFLGDAFENPPPPSADYLDKFDNLIMQKLYELTQKKRFVREEYTQSSKELN